jgi:hypothetical protein
MLVRLYIACPHHGVMDAVLEDNGRHDISTCIPLECLGAATHMTALRYSTGQAVLDNDIRREAWKSKQQTDIRDALRPKTEFDLKYLLASCPGGVLTVPLVSWFCSPTYDDLRSHNV